MLFYILPVSVSLAASANCEFELSSPTKVPRNSLDPMVPAGASLHPNHQYAVDLGNAGLVTSTAKALSLNLPKINRYV